MFKGKVTIIRNVDGKEERIEREFDSPEEYQKFMAEHGGGFGFRLPDPRLTLSEWGALGSFIDQIFEEKLADLFLPAEVEEVEQKLPVDIEKYETEAAKLEEEKKRTAEKKEQIKKAITKLKGYVKTFEKEGKKDLAESAKKDIKKLEEELKKLS